MWSFFDGMMIISVDRLLVSLLELKYKEIVTLKSTYIITAVFWFLSIVEGLFSISHTRITRWFSDIVLTSCSVISIASYKEIFRALSHHQAQLQDHVQQQPQPTKCKSNKLGAIHRGIVQCTLGAVKHQFYVMCPKLQCC